MTDKPTQDYPKDKKDVPRFELNNCELKCFVCSVYDGDTVSAIFPFGDKFYWENIRIKGIDCPELKTGDTKILAKEARDFVRSCILAKYVSIKFFGKDKYGRHLGEVSYEGHDLGKQLISRGYAVEYSGKGEKFPNK